MNEPYKVSICVPIYGVEKYIRRCVKSLFEQTYKNIEYIFVNDCTKDNSIKILYNELDNYPKRKPQVHIINHQLNKGLGEARNTAVASCTAPFIVHVDSDDWLDTTCIQRCVEHQLETDADIISFGICQVYEKKRIECIIPNYATSKELILALIKHIIPNSIWGRFIRRSLYIKNQISVTKGINMAEDLNVIPRLVYFAKKISAIPQILYFYECRNAKSYTASIFSEDNFQQRLTTLYILKKFFKDKDHDYDKAIKLREYHVLVNALIDSVKEDGHISFYKKICKQINQSYDLQMKSTLKISQRIALNLHNYNLFKTYVRAGIYIRNIITNL